MKKILFALLYFTGVTRFAAWWHRKRVVFLCYHGVTRLAERSPSDPHGLHVRRDRFEKHLDFLRRRYHVISLREYLDARLEGRRLPPHSVVLTFDDGFRNFLTAAAPCLAERSMPASIFLITDHMSEGRESDFARAWGPADDSTYLSWAEARALCREQRIEVGSHTCSHPRLLHLTPEEIRRELLDSFRAITEKLSNPRPALSYPRGEYTGIIAALAAETGYSCAVTTDRGANEMDHSLFNLGRTLVGDNDGTASFAVRVSGVRWWLARLRSVVKGEARGRGAPEFEAQPAVYVKADCRQST
jgi:peptidoglycan/xylan/chitin deacetylase (PgdA/CDA1 family)